MDPADQTPVAHRRPWWRTLPFLVLVGVLPVPFGMYFLAFIAIALLLSDTTRETEVKAGGAVLLFWWAYTFREGDTTPYFAATLLAIAAVLLARGALRRGRDRRRSAWLPAAGAVMAVVMGVVAFVPDGYRAPKLDREAAVQRTMAERAARPWRGIAASEYLVDRGRLRIVHTPVWYVVLYEPNATVARTADNQPCFSRREVWRVDAIDGSVSHAQYDEARVGGDPCLPVRQGTESDLKPLPR
ncbi:MAG: hypothetical protein QOE45_1767 [Frankiaceae bacterium]|nr:hypothetical protein [Frankiaceae bacterium]